MTVRIYYFTCCKDIYPVKITHFGQSTLEKRKQTLEILVRIVYKTYKY